MSRERDRFKAHIRALLQERKRQTIQDLELTRAAVLIPLLDKDGAWHVVVTQRTQDVLHHKGQISFPGGTCEPGDTGLQATALRETHEEIGVPPDAVEVLGALDDLVTVTDFVVTPFVGVLPHPLEYQLNPREVEAVVEVPLSFLRDPSRLRLEPVEYKGRILDVYFWDFGAHTIWGATARILKGFLDLACPDHA